MGASRILTVSPPHLELTAIGTPGYQHLDLSGASGSISVLEETSDPEVFNDVTDEYEYSITRTAHYPPPGMAGSDNPDFNLSLGTPSTGYNPAASTYYLYNMTTQNLIWAVSTNNMGDISNSLKATFTATPKDQDADLIELEHFLETMVTPPPPPPDDIETTSDSWMGQPSYTPYPKTLEDTVKEAPVSDTPLVYTGDDLVITLDARTIMYKPLALNEILDHKFKSY